MNPIGVLFICLVFVVLLYFNFGGSSQNVEHLRDKITTETVSLKALLSVSIEIAKRGGLEVKKIREQVRLYLEIYRFYIYYQVILISNLSS